MHMLEERNSDRAKVQGPRLVISIIGVLLVATLVMQFIFHSADWRAKNVLLPRYCDQPEKHLMLVRRILSEEDPAGASSKRPFIIAAKLMFLLPRQSSEPLSAYIGRLRRKIDRVCH